MQYLKMRKSRRERRVAKSSKIHFGAIYRHFALEQDHQNVVDSRGWLDAIHFQAI
jgi:hypothetical protein